MVAILIKGSRKIIGIVVMKYFVMASSRSKMSKYLFLKKTITTFLSAMTFTHVICQYLDPMTQFAHRVITSVRKRKQITI